MVAQLLYETHNCVCLSSVPVYGQGILLNLQIVYASVIAAVDYLLQFYLNVRFEPITSAEKTKFVFLIYFTFSTWIGFFPPGAFLQFTLGAWKVLHIILASKFIMFMHSSENYKKICITRKIISFSSEAVWNYKDKS